MFIRVGNIIINCHGFRKTTACTIRRKLYKIIQTCTMQVLGCALIGFCLLIHLNCAIAYDSVPLRNSYFALEAEIRTTRE